MYNAIIVTFKHNNTKIIRAVGSQLFAFAQANTNQPSELEIPVSKAAIKEHLTFTGSKPVSKIIINKHQNPNHNLYEYLNNCSFEYSSVQQAKNVIERVGKVLEEIEIEY